MTGAPNGDLEGQSNPHSELVIFAKNARIHTSEKIIQVLAELENVVWDVVLFSETRASQGKVILDGGHALFTNISDNPFAGVGILLNAKHVNKSNRIYNVSDRVLALDFVFNGKCIRSIAVQYRIVVIAHTIWKKHMNNYDVQYQKHIDNNEQ